MEIPPETILNEVDDILSEMDTVMMSSNYTLPPTGSTLIDSEELFNPEVSDVFRKYSTHVNEEGKTVSSSENLFSEIISCLSKEHYATEDEKPVLSIASPLYLSHYFENNNTSKYENVIKFIKGLQKESNGMLMAFESESPKYNGNENLDSNNIYSFNSILKQETGLWETGGSLFNQTKKES